MTSTKKDFGAFVIDRRRAAGLTQRDLADRLFVTESAVSKWERGISYPDISLLAPLAHQLAVSPAELIEASEDRAGRKTERDARVYRHWKASIRWATTIVYAVALLACFIVNLAVAHTLDWFWLVAAALAVVASLTTLPLAPSVPVARAMGRGWVVLASFLVSVIVLLVLVRALYGSGSWLPIPIAAVLFATVVVFGPIALRAVAVPPPLGRHRTVLALAADTVALVLLLLVVMLAVGQPRVFLTRALPIAGLALVCPWAIALVIRYLRVAGLYRAAIVIAFLSLYSYFALVPTINRISGDRTSNPINLSQWREPYLNGDIGLVTLLAGLLVAAVLAATQAQRAQALHAEPVRAAGPR
ncbi:MAG: helix-turn-helix domain-containing protein [Actinomycetia bacterium]|nr:helix-turn-helix domain-containing protein [Actinomycetes bacterium]